MLYDFAVFDLKEDHFEERVRDICDSVKRGSFTIPLFSHVLVPEGDPVWDKATKLAAIFVRYRDALAKEGVPAAILVQASFGHGYDITPAPFDRYVNLVDGRTEYVYCPEDERFLAHFSDVLRTLAGTKPFAIMLDDDFRLMLRPGHGCACARHMAEFNRRAGTNMTREELFAYFKTHSMHDPLARIYAETQKDSLIKAATAFRAAIDEIDPSIQGVNCTSGHICENVVYTNKIFAGKGNPTMVRMSNGIYAPYAIRGISYTFANAAIHAAKLKKHGIDIILSETDTIPFNRYAKSARYLHAQYAASLLEGARGAKHWLTRGICFEPASGKAYRDILATHRPFYERLAALAPDIHWVGVNSAFIEQTDFPFATEDVYPCDYHPHTWVTKNFEEMGIPFYFSDKTEKASFLEGSIVDDMTDAEIETVLAGSVFLDGESAEALCRRGYGDLIGVAVSAWDGGMIHAEVFGETDDVRCSLQKNVRRLTPTDPSTQILSYNYLKVDGGISRRGAAVTKLKRADGKISVVFCGSPDAAFNYMEGFSFLNETRKAQFVSLLREAGALPVYAMGDAEICMRAGYLSDGSLFVFALPLGVDPSDVLPLALEKEPASIAAISPDGEELPVAFTKMADGEYELAVRCEPLYPIALRITYEN